MAYTVTTRATSHVDKERFESLPEALAHIEMRSDELAAGADVETVDLKLSRSYEPAQQVVGRLELKGPKRLRAGLDVRGDGSSEAYTGKLSRRLIAQEHAESAAEALRRTLVGR